MIWRRLQSFLKSEWRAVRYVKFQYETASEVLCPIFASFVSVKFCSNQQVVLFVVQLCDFPTIWGGVS
jgi:hypothetical protein